MLQLLKETVTSRHAERLEQIVIALIAVEIGASSFWLANPDPWRLYDGLTDRHSFSLQHSASSPSWSTSSPRGGRGCPGITIAIHAFVHFTLCYVGLAQLGFTTERCTHLLCAPCFKLATVPTRNITALEGA